MRMSKRRMLLSGAACFALAMPALAQTALEEVVVTNSVLASEEARASKKIKFLSIGRLLGEAIRRIHNSDSVSSLFV